MKYEIDIQIDGELLKQIYREEVRRQLEIIKEEPLLIDMNELCEMLKLSRPTVEKNFLKNPDFPSMRINSKWIFNKKEVEAFLKEWMKTK
jgi:predicted DNA-binding transcriptional regulator AlpA